MCNLFKQIVKIVDESDDESYDNENKNKYKV